MYTNEKKMRSRNFLNESVRGCVAVALSLLLIPAGQPGLFAQDAPPPPQGNYPPPQGNYAPLGAEQLNQLVAPIALYPDSLVAQILTAATYPQQVMDANNWMNQMGNMAPEQRAAAADQMQWDPSVKALTAFPSVLSNMARNNNWAGALGNAYYNQPGDVMNAVQAMRIRAQSAGALRSDNHYRVLYNGGLVVIEPYNPAYVYVPYYNPWTIYGGPIVPWGGYYWGGPPRGVVLAGFGLGFAAAAISIGMFSHYGWGYNSWSPNWHGGVVVYNHTTYISRSTTVINRGYFGGNNRGVYEHAGPGVPQNFRPAVTAQSAAFRPGQARPGSFAGSNYANRPGAAPAAQTGRQFGQPGQQGRPAVTPNNNAAGRQFGQPRPTTPTAPTARPGGYSNSNMSRPATGAVSPQSRPQAPTYRPQVNSAPASHAPSGGSTPRPQPQVHTPQAAPSHQPSGGGQQHSAPHNNNDKHR
jgi:hypothetical protein